MPAPTELPRPDLRTALMGAGVAGALYGVADALLVIAADTVLPQPVQQWLLVASSMITMALLGVLLAATPLVLARLGRPALLQTAPAWLGFLLGMAGVALADAFDRWFTRPPPFTQAPPLHGNPLVFGGIMLGAALLVWLLHRLGGTSRVRIFVVLAISTALTIRVTRATRALPPRGHAAPGAPNILLVTIDTTRADHMGGDAATQTPNFDTIATNGVRFSQAYTQIPVTGPSHTTILSGLAPWTHGNLLNGVPVPADVRLLSEDLRVAGYHTGAFVSAYVLDGSVGLTRGFEVYDDDFGLLPGWASTTTGRLVAMVNRHLDPDMVLERRGDVTVDQALDWLDQAGDAPFFGWVHLFDPHGPYTPPPPWDTFYYEGDPRDPAHTSMAQARDIAPYLVPYLDGITDADWVRAQYSGEVSYADQQLGRLLDWLDTRDHLNDTIVIVLADHGESLGEHGVWFNHGGNLFEEATHVPMAMRYPGHLPRDVVVDQPVELDSVVPTIHELAGLTPPPRADGESLVPLAFGSSGAGRARSLCFDREANLVDRARGTISRPKWRMAAIHTAHRRYIWREADDYGEVLYDLDADPHELHPLDATEDQLTPLRAEVHGFVDTMATDAVDRSSTDLDPATVSRLKALGYAE